MAKTKENQPTALPFIAMVTMGRRGERGERREEREEREQEKGFATSTGGMTMMRLSVVHYVLYAELSSSSPDHPRVLVQHPSPERQGLFRRQRHLPRLSRLSSSGHGKALVREPHGLGRSLRRGLWIDSRRSGKRILPIRLTNVIFSALNFRITPTMTTAEEVAVALGADV